MPRVNKQGFPIKRKGESHTIESIKERCIEEGNCWLWQGAYSHSAPVLRHQRKVLPVRRYIAQFLQGKDTYQRYAHVKCGDLSCVCPDHIVVYTRARLQKETAARVGYAQRPERTYKLSKAAMRRNNRTQEEIDAIRNATGSIRQIARELGYNFSVVQKIRNRTTYRQLNNPFAGLFK